MENKYLRAFMGWLKLWLDSFLYGALAILAIVIPVFIIVWFMSR